MKIELPWMTDDDGVGDDDDDDDECHLVDEFGIQVVQKIIFCPSPTSKSKIKTHYTDYLCNSSLAR